MRGAAEAGIGVEEVAPGDEVEVGPFRLRFFGGRHAQIHSSIPVIDNVGVLVNESLYYGGDSFAVPEGVAVDVLAAPAGAPWMKIAEAMDYVMEVAPGGPSPRTRCCCRGRARTCRTHGSAGRRSRAAARTCHSSRATPSTSEASTPPRLRRAGRMRTDAAPAGRPPGLPWAASLSMMHNAPAARRAARWWKAHNFRGSR